MSKKSDSIELMDACEANGGVESLSDSLSPIVSLDLLKLLFKLLNDDLRDIGCLFSCSSVVGVDFYFADI